MDFAIEVLQDGITRKGPTEKLSVDLALYFAMKDDLPNAEKVLQELLANNPNSVDGKLSMANILTLYESKSKKEAGYNLYLDIRQKNGNINNIDTTIIRLVAELGK